jgi:CHAT domain-containing protein/tetratricopeptide (TPR) repeat protein
MGKWTGTRKALQAQLLFVRFSQEADITLLRRAIELFAEALPQVSPDDPRRAVYLSDYGAALRYAFEQSGNEAELHAAITMGREAVQAAPRPRPGRPSVKALCLSNLGATLVVAYERTGRLDKLHEGIATARAAVEATAERDRRRPVRMSYLGLALFRLYQGGGDAAALRESADWNRKALEGLAPGDPGAPTFKASLGITLQMLSWVTGELRPLQESILLCSAAVAEANDRDPRRSEYLSHLAGAWWLMFQRTSAERDLREALDNCFDAAVAAPPGDPRRAGCMANLAICLTDMFELKGDRESLAEALAADEAAVAASRKLPGDPNLCAHLAHRATTLGALADLDAAADSRNELRRRRAAVEASREAVRAYPADHHGRPLAMNNLAGALLALAGQDGDPGLAEEATRLARTALASVPAGSPDHGRFAGNLATCLRNLYDLTGSAQALRESVAILADTTASTPPGHPGWARNQLLYGTSLLSAAEEFGDRQALRLAQHALRSAAEALAAGAEGVATRIMTGRALALAYWLDADHDAALAAIEEAVRLLPRVAPRHLRRQDREYRLGEMAGLGAEAAACALSAGRPERAIELLELTRGVLLGESMSGHTDLARLRLRDPGLAREFELLRDRLTALETARPAFAADEDPSRMATDHTLRVTREIAARRREAEAEWESLLLRIRAGDPGFLRPPSIAELQREARHGPVVMITAAPYRGDALILTPDPRQPVRHVPLPGLTRPEATRKAVSWHRAVAPPDGAPRDEDTLKEILAWVRDTITAPVLDDLERHGYLRLPGLRLWWCPAGILAQLPLHATALDRVVSSYTPTVRALAYARRPAESGHVPRQGASLIVAVPDAPGCAPLTGVEHETSLLAGLLPGAEVRTGPAATCARVLDRLPEFPVVHFACHGQVNWSDPGGSQLIMHDYGTDSLTASAVSALHLADARLAYLSACDTAHADRSLNDEALHITAAFQLAGYRSVVGTLWQVSDVVAPRVAADVYSSLTNGGTRPPDTARTAFALHQAVRAARDRYPAEPSLWAAHVHVGG